MIGDGTRGRIEVWLLGGLAVAGGCGGHADAAGSGLVRVAVAANFADTHARLAGRFTERTGIAVRTSPGSSGQLYAQIVNGAPFDVFLSADTLRPARLEREGHAVPGSRFTYAEGRLVLYGPGLDLGPASAGAGAGVGEPGGGATGSRQGAGSLAPAALLALADPTAGGSGRLAIANPRLAPYGEAARQTLDALGLRDALASRMLLADNVGQAFQFVGSGAAELGFVAGSYVVERPAGDVWGVPSDLYDPIRQDAVRLETGSDAAADTAAVRTYLEYLRSAEAMQMIAARGYGVPDEGGDRRGKPASPERISP